MVPISLVIGLLGGSGWLTKQHYLSEANAKGIEEIKIAQKSDKAISDERWDLTNKQLSEIKQVLAEIKAEIKTKR